MAALSLLPAPVPLVTEVSSSTPHDSAEIATETNGRIVKSRTQRKEARLDTSTRRSFRVDVASSFAVVVAFATPCADDIDEGCSSLVQN